MKIPEIRKRYMQDKLVVKLTFRCISMEHFLLHGPFYHSFNARSTDLQLIRDVKVNFNKHKSLECQFKTVVQNGIKNKAKNT